MTYTVFDEGKTRHGDARQILENIRAEHAPANKELSAMDVDSYADALIEDAEYFLSDELLRAMEGEQYASKFDKALTLLAFMPSSGVRILASR